MWDGTLTCSPTYFATASSTAHRQLGTSGFFGCEAVKPTCPGKPRASLYAWISL